MKVSRIIIAACMFALVGCAQQEKAQTGEVREEPTLEEYKKMIFDAGGTGVYEAQGVDVMLADGVSVAQAVKEVGVAGGEKEPCEPTNGVRIAAWNLRWFPAGYPLKPGTEPDAKHEYERTDSVARFIRRECVGVVMLEEVRNRKVLEALVANKALDGWRINSISDFPATYGAAIPTHQNAVISKFATIDSGFVKWRRRKGIFPPRGFVWAVLDTGTNLTAVIGVHLKSNFISDDVEDKAIEAAKNTRKREESAQQVVRFAESLLGKVYDGRKVSDVFVAGDFNTSYCDPAYAKELTLHYMKDAGYRDTHTSLPEARRYTMPRSKWYPPTVFDYIFHKGTHVTKEPNVAEKQYTSDHQLISVVLTDEVTTEKVEAAKLEPLEFDLEDAEKIIDLE